MDPDRWRQARALFEAVADHPEAEWDAQLALRCDDAALRAEARALLEADRDAGVTGLPARSPDFVAALAEDSARAPSEALVGRDFGAWRLLQLIGQGGMGAVYLAERVHGGFQQRAALKLVRPGPGMEHLAERFRTERQILAGLEHPNIARLLDGGAGPHGEPFLALEYVDGRNLRAHCDALRLGLRERLRLFLTVCEAVAHAHARLVVHRDLKPGNILVADDGSVKLLDFGVAKLLDDAAPAEATVARLRLYTPEYAAPEQIRGEPTTTAVDVWALGVVLFELLTGQRPFAGDAAAVEAAVLRSEAPRPSQVVTRNPVARIATPVRGEPVEPGHRGNGSTGSPRTDIAKQIPGKSEADPATPVQGEPVETPVPVATLAQAAAHARRSTPAQLRTQLRGDLDHIVQRALRHAPEQRYASVRAFADDIEAFLAQRPVAARRGNARYRLARFVQRHALATALAGIALAALVAGLGASLWQAREARAQRDLAQQEAGKARAALDFMTGLFTLADPEVTRGADVTARELLAQGTARIRTSLQDQPEARAELLRAMGEAHLGLGLYDEAEPLLGEALAHDAAAKLPHAIALHELGRNEPALAELEALRAERAAQVPVDQAALARIDLRLGMVHQTLNHLDESDAAYTRALEAQHARFGPLHRETIESELRYASLRVLRRESQAARDRIAPIVAALRAQSPRDDVLFARALGALAMAVSNTGPLSEAEALRREQLALSESIYGENHPRTLSARNDLASVLFAKADYAAAAPLFAQVLETRRAEFGPDHPAVATVGNNLATAMLQLGRPREALPLAEEALRVRLAVYGELHHTTGASLRTLAGALYDTGELERAQALLERAVAVFDATLGPENMTVVGSINDLVRVRVARGQPDADCALARRALRMTRAEEKPDDPPSHWQFALLGACRAAHGEADGREAMVKALPILEAAFGAKDRRTRTLRKWLST